MYEDLVAAWVPAKHEWLRPRPLGHELVNKLGKQNMFTYCACTLTIFLIFDSIINKLVFSLFVMPHSFFGCLFLSEISIFLGEYKINAMYFLEISNYTFSSRSLVQMTSYSCILELQMRFWIT